MSCIIRRASLDLNVTQKAFPYQVEAFNAVKDLPYSAIFHEQGLGKTKIAIDLCLYWLEKKDIDTVVIVTKKQLVKNWDDEFKFHTHIKPSIMSNKRSDNYLIFNGISEVIITNFEAVMVEQERFELFLKCRHVAVILDESTKIKNPESKISQCFFSLSDGFKFKTIMTGTPVANRPYDIWAQIYFLDKGKSLGEDFIAFKKQHDLSNKLQSDLDLRNTFENNVGEVFNKISSFSVRETKKSCAIDLPQKSFHTILADFEGRQHELYQKIVKECQVEVYKDGSLILDNDEECLKRLLRLNQVASNPSLIDDSYKRTSGKEKALDSLLNEIIERKEKVIIWSSYIQNIDILKDRYKCYGAVKIHGRMAIEDRNKAVDKFKKDETCRVLFATPQAAKEGLTLTVANNAIFYDRTFNLDDYLQAQDRIHRISQKKNCFIYIIKIHNSIDDWIDALLVAKQQAAFLAQGDISKDEYKALADYSYSQLIKNILEEAEGHE